MRSTEVRRTIGWLLPVMLAVAFRGVLASKIGVDSDGDHRIPSATTVAASGCEMNANYSDDLGVVYGITQREWTVSVVPLYVPKGRKIGWIYANGSIDPQTLRITMVFNYTSQTDTVLGTLRWGCSEIDYDNRATWYRPDASLQKIHLVYMTHLDVGFTNGARNVCDTYFSDHFPRAMQTASALRKLGGEERFVYTEFPWLVHEYLTGAAGCAHTERSEPEIAAFKAAIAAGDISWHALSLNILTELYDPAHFDWSLGIKDKLNTMLGEKNGLLCGKHTDVPGMSISAVPRMAAHGVRAVHIGYNAACVFPRIPDVFRWRHDYSGTEVIVMAEKDYGRMIRIPELLEDEALVFMYTPDNARPPNSTQVQDFWRHLRRRYPAASINAANPFDSFAAVLEGIRDKLPVVTAEIGNSWLYGAPADPFRISAYRTAIQAIDEALASGELDSDNPSLENYYFRLMKPMEHNWGLSVGQYLPELRDKAHGNWSNAEFYAVRNRSDYRRLEEEWAEQNQFCFPAAEQLERRSRDQHTTGHLHQWNHFAAGLSEKLRKLRTRSERPPTAHRHTMNREEGGGLPLSTPYTCFDRFQVSFNGTDGSIIGLLDSATNRTWLSPAHPAGVFRYRTYSMADFDNFNRGYNPGCGPPCGDFSKEGMASADAESIVWTPKVQGFTAETAGQRCTFSYSLVHDEQAYTKYGAPRGIAMTVTLEATNDTDPGHGEARGGEDAPGPPGTWLRLTTSVVWTKKPATRLAEAMFLSFNPIVASPELWRMDVLGHGVAPLDVVAYGTRHLHAVWSGVRYADASARVLVNTSHTPLVSPGDIDHLLYFDGGTQPDLARGWHFNLYNNLWGTAFPQWSSEDGQAEFSMHFYN